VLKELGHHRGHVAQVVLGAAVLDDIIGVIMLAVLIQYTQVSGVDILPSLKMLGFISIFLSAAYFVGPYIERALLLLGKGSRTPGVVITLVICLMLALSALAHSFGAPEIIGAFAAGIALSGKPSSSSGLARRADIKAGELVGPVAEVFVPVFFVMVGVSIDFGRIDASSGHFGGGHFWAFAGILTVAAFLTKMLAGVWVKGPLRKKLAAGVAMAPRGEVGLIFAQTGLLYGIFDQSTYASMVFVVALTTLAAPVLLKIVAGSADSGGGRPVI
jgi:Kef-type K+ transport system membrane component KefB